MGKKDSCVWIDSPLSEPSFHLFVISWRLCLRRKLRAQPLWGESWHNRFGASPEEKLVLTSCFSERTLCDLSAGLACFEGVNEKRLRMTHRQSLLFVLEAKYWSVGSLFCLVIGLLFSLFVEGLNFFAKSCLFNANVKTEQMLWTMLFFYGWIMECLCVFVFETTKQRAKGSFAVFVTVRSPKSCCTLQRDSGTHRIPLSLLWCKDQCYAEICCK